ncbi:MAG: hypothetical protein A2754_03460 [Candidatus Magasanikbacteria bacterium RIFCSPHIGHO2_01_FULL_47_8]|uniref:Dipeptidylpeptidase IV N-terminal domain-containing protein n=1 Tax=Candidatus Magasanikbacteria bacterium RIFCSPHIGHO2_01_FULL_47_8 TaxID=1798673 RepID=A0A1F6MDH6_9BACT|nr:MAG: hypothetical protein A2754_03460 [Candidatus Magasanikbacteria bacterium RIFCSPHIGHO2_01_FULL_47_8]
MSPTIKRILLITGLIAVAALLAIGLYLVFKKTTVTPPTGGEPVGEGGQLPTAGERGEQAPGGVVTEIPGGGVLPPAGSIGGAAPAYFKPIPVEKVTSDFSSYTSVNANGQLRYQNGADGKFYRIGIDGKPTEMADQVFYNVQNVTWAKSKDKAVLEYPDGSKIIYDFDNKKQVTLPRHWQDFSFSPDSSEIAAKSLALAPENRWLVVSKDDGTGTRLIEPLGENADKVIMSWSPSRQTVALAQTGQPVGADRREILFIGLNGENFKSTIVEGADFMPQWSTTGKKLLYSVDSARSDFKPELWVVNAYGEGIGSERRMLELNTWANKCTFADDTTLFCAVPRELPTGAGMSPEIAADTADDLYKIDLRTGLKTSIPLDQNYTIDTLSFDGVNNKLFFSDHHQTGVFGVSL